MEKWFVFNDNFELSRNNTVTLYGVVNLDIAEDKVFSCEAEYSSGAAVCDACTKTQLKMHGAGTLKVNTLTAAGEVTLDYSALTASRAAAYIDGNLKINDATTLVLPADLAANQSFPLCTGTLTGGTSSLRKVTVGTTDKFVYLTFSGNSVSYAEMTSAALLDGVEKASAQAAFDDAQVGSTICLGASASVTLDSAKSLKNLYVLADATIGGSAALTITGDIDVFAGCTCTLSTPLLLSGTAGKNGKGELVVNAKVAGAAGVERSPRTPEKDETGDQLVVREGSATFDGAITNVLIRGLGKEGSRVRMAGDYTERALHDLPNGHGESRHPLE